MTLIGKRTKIFGCLAMILLGIAYILQLAPVHVLIGCSWITVGLGWYFLYKKLERMS